MQRHPGDVRSREAELLADVAAVEVRLRDEQERAARLASEAQLAALRAERLERREAELSATLQRITVELRGGHQVALTQQNKGLAAALALLLRVVEGHVRQATAGSPGALRQMMELAAEDARRLGPEVSVTEVVDRLLAPPAADAARPG